MTSAIKKKKRLSGNVAPTFPADLMLSSGPLIFLTVDFAVKQEVEGWVGWGVWGGGGDYVSRGTQYNEKVVCFFIEGL